LRVILDTNVLLSGIFFSGVPYQILNAWRNGKLSLVVSAEILDEYHRVGRRLSTKYPGVDPEPILTLVEVHTELVDSPSLDDSVCVDPTDDIFFACAVASRCSVIISGDKHLHQANGYRGIRVFSPREFVEAHFSQHTYPL